MPKRRISASKMCGRIAAVLRRDYDWSICRIAIAADVSHDTVRRWIAGSTEPRGPTARRVLEILELALVKERQDG